jgi:hypothetical protein
MRHLPLICFNFLATPWAYFRPVCRSGNDLPGEQAAAPGMAGHKEMGPA